VNNYTTLEILWSGKKRLISDVFLHAESESNFRIELSRQIFTINYVKDIKKAIFGYIYAFIPETVLSFKIHFESSQYDILFLRYMILKITESQVIVDANTRFVRPNF